MADAYRGMQIEELGIQDPAVQQAFLMLNGKLRRAFEEVEKYQKASEIKVVVNGKTDTLDKMLSRALVPVGAIIDFWISWADALKMENLGWVPCDGTRGTPPLMAPQQGGELSRFRKSVLYGRDPWANTKSNPRVGGSTSIAISIEDHTVSVADHTDHAHSIDAQELPPLDFSSNEPDAYGTDPAHNHNGATYTVNDTDTLKHRINSGALSASATLAHTTDEDVESLPPYCECIPMMRIR